MDDSLRLIQYLYDEDDVDGSAVVRRLSEDETLYREYERLRDVKERLDERPSRRPDSAVVDRVVEEARSAAQNSPSPPRLEGDRPARSPTRSRTRRLQTAGAALALLLLIGLGWWQVPGAPEESAAGSSTDGLEKTAPAAAERSAGAEAVPAWDESDELVRIHRRLERLQAQSRPNTWGSLQRVDQRRP
jgi:hypothetical protein